MSLLDWFKTKKFLIEENIKLRRLTKVNVTLVISTLKSLDQDKIYYVYNENFCPEDIENFNNVLKIAGAGIKWTPPKIVIGNVELKG